MHQMEKNYPYIQINSVEELPQPEEESGLVGHYSFQYIDFSQAVEYVASTSFVDCCFFGCRMVPQMIGRLNDCLILPRMGQVFKAFLSELYNAGTLYAGFDPKDPSSFRKSFDSRVYVDYIASGAEDCSDLRIMLARSLHDHSVGEALTSFLEQYNPTDVVGIMGGHGLKREDEGYAKIVYVSKVLTERGKLMLSGGGPGAMEATHLGAWMAGRSTEETEDAIRMLVAAGEEDNYSWLESAFRVMEKYPQDNYRSLAIPTWLYGHEPSTPFATHIAKFFANSIREDMILSTALGGVIFTPGSAGTMQEIFQNASKLHYDSDGIVGPMIFLGRQFFTETIPVYPFLKDLCNRGKYVNLHLSITDAPGEVISTIIDSCTE